MPPCRSIYDVLDYIRRTATSEAEKGILFEQLMVAYLSTDPTYARQFANVCRWVDWPGRGARGDSGVDLVAEDRETGDLTAIQCKFYDPDHRLDKADLDSFFTESGKAPFAARMIISTTDRWTTKAEEAMVGQQIPVSRLRVQDLDASPVDWDAFDIGRPKELVLRPVKELRLHQDDAIAKVIQGLSTGDRGKLIMACGTGKTFTALRLAEQMVGAGGKVLFLVPSISLLSQSLKEWSSEAKVPLRVFAVCSDVQAGKRTESDPVGPYDLAFPATTNAERLAALVGARPGDEAMTVVFSTYQSVDKVAAAQAAGVGPFDLVICDEAHRTTGVTLAEEDESAFVRVHDNEYLAAAKRLYMTATPRIYGESSKQKAKEAKAELCSMDDPDLYGPELHRLGFGEAVERNLLSDYRVLVLAVDEEYVSRTFQSQLADTSHELNLDDAAKIVGCLNGLGKRGVSDQTFAVDPASMRRAVAFCSTIASSKKIVGFFNELSALYAETVGDGAVHAEASHVDGTHSALIRAEKLDWLRGNVEAGDCRILSNARCLSEGVDVPALDAVLFLNPRKSQVDVVQSVGRVMRAAAGKTYGYVILPIGVPAGVAAEEALADNERYKVVWQVLQALRAHDDRFSATVNKIDLTQNRPDQLQVIGVGGGKDSEDGKDSPTPTARTLQGAFSFGDIEDWQGAIYAKIVEKVGDRRYWEDWAKDVAAISERQVSRIKSLLRADSAMQRTFAEFVEALHRNINESVTDDDAIEMLSQHLITKPVFESLFSDYAFASNNPVSVAMQQMVDALGTQGLEKEVADLEGFYASVRKRAEGIDTAEGKQKIVLELYEKFFKTALPKVTDRLGIVYTPVEIVDFMVASVEEILRTEFGVGIADEGVHVLDPFTGTGTFLVRLIQSGLIDPSALPAKYSRELHANEIVLLAYYIAAVNIEAAYHGVIGGSYQPFEGIVFTDTFQLYESGGSMDKVFFPQNNERVRRQMAADIRVVIGNPPYSVGQGSENDSNKNLKYPTLDQRIRDTYAAGSTAGLVRNLYDSYIRAFRWASDRIADKGIVCFVTNGAFIDSGSADGFRKCLSDEFTSAYIFNLRGNMRAREWRAEGGQIFGAGSQTPIAITLLVKNPEATSSSVVRYQDIGDYLSREDKLRVISEFGEARAIPWTEITPNEAGDWVNQRNAEFETFQPLGAKKDASAQPMFDVYSLGVVTNRDAWAFNFSRSDLLGNMSRMIDFYNQQVVDYGEWKKKADRIKNIPSEVDTYLTRPDLRDPAQISWTRDLKKQLSQGKVLAFEGSRAVPSMYRPYCKQWLYFDRRLNEQIYQIPKIFPTATHHNIVIAVSASGSRSRFSVLATDLVPSLHLADASNGSQCFPLYVYEPLPEGQMLAASREVVDGYERRYAITDATLESYQKRYGGAVTKEDIFYYVYGILHSPTYRTKFAPDLGKMIPRIPMAQDFAGFASAGRELASWHLGYESIEPYPLEGSPDSSVSAPQLQVVEMKYAKAGGKPDQSTIIYNSQITLSGIPEEAHRYDVNGRSALEWIVDRYKVTTDKASGIRNDPNTWSGDPRYIVDLVGRIVRVSLETVKIVEGLPEFKW